MIKLELKINHLNKRRLDEVQDYINSKKFQKDFPNGYWESGNSKPSGRVLEVKGELIRGTDIYSRVTIRLREDEDLNYAAVRENLGILSKHYRNIIKIIFSEPTNDLQ